MTPPPVASEDPDDAVWQEYEVTMFGDAMRAVSVLLPALAAGCGIALLLLALSQVGLLPVLDPWLPSGANGLLESTYPVALLLGAAALALTVAPGELASWSLQRTLLRAVRQREPRTRVPHPQQSRLMVTGYLTCAGGIVSMLGLIVVAIVLLVRFVTGSFDGSSRVLTVVTFAYALVLVAAYVSFEQRRKKRPANGYVPGKKTLSPREIVQSYWSKAFAGSVWSQAARAAGYEQIGDARRQIRGQAPRRGNVTPTAAAPPAVFGGRGPEWTRRERPRLQLWLVRARAVLAALALTPLVTQRSPWYEIDAALAVFVLTVLVLVLIVHILLIVARRRERAVVVKASRDSSASRPAEGPLTRHNAARTLESAWLGALLVGVIMPFTLAVRRETGTMDTVLWGLGALFVLCVLAQILEAHVGRRTRNQIMARWPSLWHSKDLSS